MRRIRYCSGSILVVLVFIPRIVYANEVSTKLFSFIENYHSLVISTLAIFMLLIFILLSMLITIRKRKRVEQQLLHANDEFTALYEQMAATEEELRHQYDLKEKNEQQLKQSQERYQLALEGANDVIWNLDFTMKRVFTSSRIEKVFGIIHQEEGYDYQSWLEVMHPDDRTALRKALKNHLAGRTPYYFIECRIMDSKEREIWVAIRGKALFDKKGKALRVAGSMSDITEQKHAREQVEYMAYYDSLTNLPNRFLFDSKLKECLVRGREEQQPVAFILIDLDNFKTVNDMYGHHAGDILLKNISECLLQFLSEKSFVCRFGGDEFILFLYGYSSRQEVEEFIRAIRSCIERPIQIKSQLFHPTASMGIALFPSDGEDFDELLQCADLALYKVKGEKKASFRFFEADMRKNFIEKLEVENGIKRGLKQNEFRLFFQPQVDLKTGEVKGVEALLRWEHPERGLVYPLEFISIAEETGLIIPLGTWVLSEACAFAKKVLERTGKTICVAVNISPLQLEEWNFVEMVQEVLETQKLSPSQLEIEITESILLKSFNEVTKKINVLRDLGVIVAMDDFGTGYSSLTYMQRLPIDILKIDREFVANIDLHQKSNALVASIIDLSHIFGFRVVAEGIEDHMHIKALQKMKCDIGQGYYISHPLPEKDCISWLENH